MKHMQYSRKDYAVRIDRESGRLEFTREQKEPPEHIVITLEFIQYAHPELVQVSADRISLLNDTYRVLGWSDKAYGLNCELVKP